MNPTPSSSSTHADTPAGANASANIPINQPSISATLRHGNKRTVGTHSPQGTFQAVPGTDPDAAIASPDHGAVHDPSGPDDEHRSATTSTPPVIFRPKSNLAYTGKRELSPRPGIPKTVPTDAAVLAAIRELKDVTKSTVNTEPSSPANSGPTEEIPEVNTPGTSPTAATPEPDGTIIPHPGISQMRTVELIAQQFINGWYLLLGKHDNLRRAGYDRPTIYVTLAIHACVMLLIACTASVALLLTWPTAILIALCIHCFKTVCAWCKGGYTRCREFTATFMPWHIPRYRIGLPSFGVYADISATVIAVPRSLVRFAKYYYRTAVKIAVVLAIWHFSIWVYGKAWEQGYAKCTSQSYRENIGTFFFPIDSIPVSRGSGHITQRLSDLLRMTICEVRDQAAWFGIGHGCEETRVSFYAWKNAHYGLGMDIMPWCLLAFTVPVFLRSARLFVFIGYWTVIIRSIIITSPSPDYGPCGYIVDDVLWPLAAPWVILFGLWQVVSSIASLWDMFRARDPIVDLVEGLVELKSTMLSSGDLSEIDGDIVSDTDLRSVPGWAVVGLIAVAQSPLDSTITTDKIAYITSQWKGKCSSGDPKEHQAREAWFSTHTTLVLECVRLFLIEKVAERVRQGICSH